MCLAYNARNYRNFGLLYCRKQRRYCYGDIFFTFASCLDGVDGMVARTCNLKTEFGKWLDPLCDRISYITPLLIFLYYGVISLKLMALFAAVELAGQFVVREVLKRYDLSVAANNVGKVKAVICFALVIYAVLLHGSVFSSNYADFILIVAITLSFWSSIAKFPYSFFMEKLAKNIKQFM